MKKNESLVKDITAKIFKMEELVDYQKDAVVSKTLIDRESGTLTLFALDKGQTISQHTVPHNALVLILDGEAKIRVGEEELEPKQGESTVMPADVPHSLKAEKRFKMLLTMIR
ncbi:cupin [candidate division MSBL1 archaeon SCGC-AAA382K21]|uniref:Cupin n=1 Tax=candidate division MSBL1 archaeon SCGC-AAA382K21 TaxID=1698283 RepID=A0A133VKW1_9EURY|nr:cupin [candidate division MSBL1 archaeon SCGC-AAA382K21]